MSKDFSDAPLTVNGVTVKPAWAWSREYRAEVAEGMRQSGSSDLSAKDRERRYVEWFAAKNDLTEHQARKKLGCCA